MMNKNLTIYRALISDTDGDNLEVEFIALVDFPAIEKNFLAFDKAGFKRQTFAINEEEQVITGIAMIADLPVYRNQDGEEFYIVFEAQEIKSIAQRFFRKKYNFNLNLDHSPDRRCGDGAYIFESWIVDRKKGKLPMEQFKDVSDGTWFVSAKIQDPEIWKAVKNGEFKGFSIEGVFNMEEIEMQKQYTETDFQSDLLKALQEAGF